MVDDFHTGPLQLQCGRDTGGLRLRYELHGRPNAERSNVILFPTWFAARHPANRWIIGPGRALDTERFCVLVVNALGNGESSSPSNDTQLLHAGRPVAVTLYDNVRAQHGLARHLGIERFAAIVGRSMGAQQALQWGCLYPRMTGSLFAFCGLPRTTPHNRLLLQGMADTLERPGLPPADALALAARIYGAWSLSHSFFAGPHADATAWVDRELVPAFQQFDPRDLLMLMRTWQGADISDNPVFAGNLRAALHAIRARTQLLAISDDLIFPPQDFELAQACIPDCHMAILSSAWGHRAAAPGGSAEDIAYLEHALRRWLGIAAPTAFESLALVCGRLWIS